eukprot:gnl/Dysnectes_brevis/4616_a6282_661.p1 GENE.gnl/Dysnectes_brevis/4616_a6282_661~~gnl/Dysnectes_brevis/4616_a6282_661.p1  ORF type:complete len:520 (+),score=41.02 gnl/Dysnectes_brevis/4616_a6282_661:143-1702(+)
MTIIKTSTELSLFMNHSNGEVQVIIRSPTKLLVHTFFPDISEDSSFPFRVVTETELPPTTDPSFEEKSQTIHAVMGMISLPQAGPCLVVVTEVSNPLRCRKSCKDQSTLVFFPSILSVHKVEKVLAIPIHPTRLSEKDRSFFKDMKHIFTERVYFSPDHDLSLSFQERLSDQPTPQTHTPHSIYMWNHALAQGLPEGLVTPMIAGRVSARKIQISADNTVEMVVLARRHPGRTGPRFYARGLENGICANRAEVELAFMPCLDTLHSLVVARGSCPVEFAQPPTARFRPPLQLTEPDYEATRQHLRGLSERWGALGLVCLLEGEGFEGPLTHRYREAAETMDDVDVNFLHWDYRHRLKREGTQGLGAAILPQMHQHGHFIVSISDGVIQERQRQHGILRINCLDSVDRTTVAQTVAFEIFAHIALSMHSPSAAAYSPSPSAAAIVFPKGIRAVRRLSLRAGDAISFSYMGSPVLKRDVVLSGKRSRSGQVQDGMTSLLRYVVGRVAIKHRLKAADRIQPS